MFLQSRRNGQLDRIRTDCRGFQVYHQLLWNLYGDVSAHCHGCKYQTLQPALLELGFVESGRHPCVIIQKMLLMVTQMVDGKELEQKLAIMLTIYIANLYRYSLRTSISLSLGFIYDW